MPTVEAEIPTGRASRYLVQLCNHASQMSGHRMLRLPAHVSGTPHAMPKQVTAEWNDTNGTISTDGGTCTLRATGAALIVRIEAGDEDTLHRMRDLITKNLTRFSRREPLTLNWQRLDATEPVQVTTKRRSTTLLVIAAVAVLAHLVLGGAILAAPQWTTLTADAILAIVLIKAALVGLGYLIRRQRG